MDDVVQVFLEFLSEPAVGRRLPGGASKTVACADVEVGRRLPPPNSPVENYRCTCWTKSVAFHA